MAYEPENPPSGLEPELAGYLYRELQRVSNASSAVDNLQLVELHVAPERPRTGMVVLADGTNWNPGSGAGFYGYSGGAWTFLG